MSVSTYAMLAVVVIGWRIFARGRRGRAIDDPPVCARCKFDLTGRAPNSDNCPECGNYLRKLHAIEIGNRQRRAGLMVAGLTLAMLPALPLLASLALWSARVDPIRFKPVWWLLRDAAARPDNYHNADLVELNARVLGGGLSQSDDQKLVSVALRLQGNLGHPWNPLWGDIVEAMRGKGQLSAADWQTYLSQDEPATLEVRPRVAWGDPIPFHLSGELRGATPLTTPRAGMGVRFTGAVPGAVTEYPQWSGGFADHFDLSGTVNLTAASRDLLRPGPQLLLATFTGMASAMEATPMLFAPIKCQGSWTLLRKGEPSVVLYRDEVAAAAATQALTVQMSRQSALLFVEARTGVPTDLGLAGFIRSGGAEWSPPGSGVVAHRGQSGPLGMLAFDAIATRLGDHADVVLRPSVNAAAHTVHIDRLLDHEFVFKNVPTSTAR